MMNSLSIATALVVATSAPAAFAFDDAVGDLLPSFTGTPVGGLDLLQSSAVFDAATGTFTVTATAHGPIDGVADLGFAFGFDRGGANNAAFAAIGFPDVKFNAVALLRSNGTAAIGNTAIPVWVSGNTISASFSADLLPSTGLDAAQFTWALWSQDLSVSGLARNADFGPAANIQVSSVPEPGAWALMAAGLGLLALRRRAA
jgi:PEP-CTERM motif